MVRHQYNRHSVRLKSHDYAASGAYFVTICTQDKVCHLGQVIDGCMHLSLAGQEVRASWEALTDAFPTIRLDAYCIMPNHVHAIIWIDPDTQAPQAESLPNAPARLGDRFSQDNRAPKLGQVIRHFKALATYRVRRLLDLDGVLLWQRSCWDRVVRNHRELEATRRYIANNPVNWHDDDLFA